MTDHLLFSLNSIRYCVEASAVREIFWLPELSLIEEAPSYIAGVINLRGHILPVMSLEDRFQRTRQPMQLTDRVIVLESNDIKMGVLVSDVHDVVFIPPADIEPLPRYFEHPDTTQHFISGEAKLDDTIWMVLDLDTLINAPDFANEVHPEMCSEDFFQHVSGDERAIFRARAKHLGEDNAGQMASDQGAFVVIQVEQEFYAVATEEILEFCHLRQFTPIPCCPNYIMGNMNLRGDILTLVDVRPILSLGLVNEPTEVIVVESEGLRVGLPVTKVHDVISLSPSAKLPLPTYIAEASKDYCTSAIPYNEHIASVLDIKTLLGNGTLEVNEAV